MPQITDIQAQKKRAGYYNIFVDECFFCSLSDLQLATRALKIGQSLEQTELKRLKEDSDISKTYNRALYYLRFGPRTVSQMRTYLLSKDYTSEHVEIALEKLQTEHYIDDESFVESWIEQRQALKSRSRRQLYIELLKKGIEKQLIEKKLSEIEETSEGSAIQKLIEKKGRQTQYQDPQKMTQYLLRQGFRYSDIRQAFEELKEID